ncbi:hypothetical protein LZ554_003487 [Drepanopeziza brunnea f. sp. 'monogermtubi']|nr:hypothetical protein LZ554_003487 [Drepanopeziza brunnea f. sp. 'monogermtubi']
MQLLLPFLTTLLASAAAIPLEKRWEEVPAPPIDVHEALASGLLPAAFTTIMQDKLKVRRQEAGASSDSSDLWDEILKEAPGIFESIFENSSKVRRQGGDSTSDPADLWDEILKEAPGIFESIFENSSKVRRQGGDSTSDPADLWDEIFKEAPGIFESIFENSSKVKRQGFESMFHKFEESGIGGLGEAMKEMPGDFKFPSQ